jgi:cell shape-determining protein MreC
MLLSKNRVIRRRAVVGLLVAASLTLLTMSYREGSTGVVGSVQRNAAQFTAPFATVAHRVTSPFVDGWHWTTGLVTARNQTAQLHIDTTKLGLAASTIKQLEADLKSARAAAHWVEQNPQYHTVSGSVILESGGELGPTNTVELGIGSDQGVRVNDAVVAPSNDGGGLVGRVSEVTSGTATVQTLLDPETGVTAAVQGELAAVGTVVPSTGTLGNLTMEQVPLSARVRKDDTVITTAAGQGSRLQSFYPAGIPIGRVAAVTNNDIAPSGDHMIQVTPFVDFSTLSDVVVLESH